MAQPSSSAARANRLSAVALATMLALVAVVIVMTLAGLGLLLPGWLSTHPTASPSSVDASTVALDALPPEAQQTLHLIQAGGPYPYRQDGAVFSNREGLLPRQPSGYYREYTVVTPGSPDRGARRIIVGKGGETYYTDDHYASFREVLDGSRAVLR